ncbi:hypothetical protein HPB49_026421 [Dermacentor silvarum]|nr:hypothetical protein HPB49_026421 [Dermacentor silvarum]
MRCSYHFQAVQDRNKLAEEFDEDTFSDSALTREVHQPSQPWKDAVTSVKCPRKARQSLSLCTATLFFVLSQDRLTMDLDASTLSLMLQLFESDPQQGEGGLTPPGAPPLSSLRDIERSAAAL